MGSFDGAEVLKLVGTLLLHIITPKYDKSKIGLYRDDRLVAFDEPPQIIERIKKDLCKMSNAYNLKIMVDVNHEIINYPDLTIDLISDQYYPYTKPSNTPWYVNSKSYHPPVIIKKKLPTSINRRLCDISSNEEVFNKPSKTVGSRTCSPTLHRNQPKTKTQETQKDHLVQSTILEECRHKHWTIFPHFT